MAGRRLPRASLRVGRFPFRILQWLRRGLFSPSPHSWKARISIHGLGRPNNPRVRRERHGGRPKHARSLHCIRQGRMQSRIVRVGRRGNHSHIKDVHKARMHPTTVPVEPGGMSSRPKTHSAAWHGALLREFLACRSPGVMTERTISHEAPGPALSLPPEPFCSPGAGAGFGGSYESDQSCTIRDAVSVHRGFYCGSRARGLDLYIRR